MKKLVHNVRILLSWKKFHPWGWSLLCYLLLFPCLMLYYTHYGIYPYKIAYLYDHYHVIETLYLIVGAWSQRLWQHIQMLFLIIRQLRLLIKDQTSSCPSDWLIAHTYTSRSLSPLPFIYSKWSTYLSFWEYPLSRTCYFFVKQPP